MNLHSIASSKPLKRRKAFMPLDTPAPDTTMDKAPSEGAGASRAAEHAWATSSRAPVYGRGGSVPKTAPMPRAAPVAPKPPAMMGGITLGRGGMRKAPHAPGLVPKTISDKRGRKMVVYVRMDGVPQSTGVQKTLFDTLSNSPKVNADPHQIQKMTSHTEAGAQDGIFNALPDRARSSKPHAIGSRVKINHAGNTAHNKTGTVEQQISPLEYSVKHDNSNHASQHHPAYLEAIK